MFYYPDQTIIANKLPVFGVQLQTTKIFETPSIPYLFRLDFAAFYWSKKDFLLTCGYTKTASAYNDPKHV